MEVKIVYCVPCNYLPMAEIIKKAIKEKVRNANITLEGGKSGVMDVFVDGKLIFSKQREGRFPETFEILEKVEEMI